MLPDKVIVQSDALAWLESATLTEKHAVVASIPDSAELPNGAFEPWKAWFSLVAEKVIERAHPSCPVIFYQSDVRRDGTWVDKGFLVHQAASRMGASLLMHRIVCRRPAGYVTRGRSTYSHLMMFSKELRNSQRFGYSDVIPDGGKSVWIRGIGIHSCEQIVRMVRQESTCETLVHLFCGKGLLLEVAREQGLHTIGIDLSRKQCRHAERFDLEKFRTAAEPAPAVDGE